MAEYSRAVVYGTDEELGTCLKFFTARAGVVMFTFEGLVHSETKEMDGGPAPRLTLQIMTGIVNAVYPNEEEDSKIKTVQYVFLYIFLCIMIMAYIIGFSAAYTSKEGCAQLAIVFMAVGILMLLCLAILSCLPTHRIRRTSCVDFRCPDLHWFQDAGWRRQIYEPSLSEGDHSRFVGLYMFLSVFFGIIITGKYLLNLYVLVIFRRVLRKQKQKQNAPDSDEPIHVSRDEVRQMLRDRKK